MEEEIAHMTEGVTRRHHWQGSGGNASANVPGLQSSGSGNGDKGNSGTIRMAMEGSMVIARVNAWSWRKVDGNVVLEEDL